MTMKLKCPICGNNGILITKTTITKTATKQYQYEKWYVYHNARKESKQKWCYLSKNYLEQPEIKEAIKKQLTTQNTTQNDSNIKTVNSELILRKESNKISKWSLGRDLIPRPTAYKESKMKRQPLVVSL